MTWRVLKGSDLAFPCYALTNDTLTGNRQQSSDDGTDSECVHETLVLLGQPRESETRASTRAGSAKADPTGEPRTETQGWT